MEKSWFVQFDDHHRGPLTDQEIIDLVYKHTISQDSFLWREGMPYWERIDLITNFKDHFPPRSLPSNKPERLYSDRPRVNNLPPIPTPEPEPLDKLIIFKKLSFFLLSIIFLSGVGLYIFKASKVQKPPGLNDSQFVVLKDVINVSPEEKILFKTSFNNDENTLWLSSNLPSNGIINLSFSALPGKSFTLNPIEFQSRVSFVGPIAKIEKFKFNKGSQIYPGLYHIHIDYTLSGEGRRWSDVIYLGGESEDEFVKNLETYKGYVSKVFNDYHNELQQKYQTLISLTQEMEDMFEQNMKGIRRGSQINRFQKGYVEKIGPLLTDFAIDNFYRPLEIKLDLSELQNQFRTLHDLSKRLGQIASDIVVELSPKERITSEKRDEYLLMFRSGFRKLKQDIYYNQNKAKQLKPFK